MKLKILTNFKKIKDISCNNLVLDVCDIPSSILNIKQLFSFVLRSNKVDYVVLNNGSTTLILILCLCKLIFPLNHIKIVAVDILLSEPKRCKDKVKSHIVKILLSKVHLFLLLYKNTRGLERVYSIQKSKIRYIPFKINQIDYIQSLDPVDEGYIFCGGKTRRDFDTLFTAVRGLNCNIKLVTTANKDILKHGSFLNTNAAPKNVEIIILDGNYQDFINLISRASFVLMPILPDICGAGIGVYIMSMALKKCVIISSGPGAEDVIPEGAAIIVPAQNPEALRRAILQVSENKNLRDSIAATAYKYATPLGGEKRFLQSVVSVLHDDHLRNDMKEL